MDNPDLYFLAGAAFGATAAVILITVVVVFLAGLNNDNDE